MCKKKGGLQGKRGKVTVGNTHWGNEWQIQFHTRWQWLHISEALFLHVLLFVSGLPGLGSVLSVCRGRDGVHGGTLLAGGLGRVGGMGEAGPGLAGVVVELHQAEDQVCRHELKLVRGVGDDIPAWESRGVRAGG